MNQPRVGSYPVVLTLNEFSQGGSCGLSNYGINDSKCGGSLFYMGADGEKHILKQKAEYGKCADGALIHLEKVDAQSIKCEWFSPSGKKASEGVLYLGTK